MSTLCQFQFLQFASMWNSKVATYWFVQEYHGGLFQRHGIDKHTPCNLNDKNSAFVFLLVRSLSTLLTNTSSSRPHVKAKTAFVALLTGVASQRGLWLYGRLVSGRIMTLCYSRGNETEMWTDSIVSWIIFAPLVHIFPGLIQEFVADAELPQHHEFPCWLIRTEMSELFACLTENFDCFSVKKTRNVDQHLLW